MKNKKICIVGYGSHVKNTILPSLNFNPKYIKVVTSKHLDDFETFSNIKQAVKALPKDYIFFNSTPPSMHYSTSKLILSSGFNVIVEKPLCIKVDQLKKLKFIAKQKNLFIFENMMYFYSKQFKLLKKIITKKKIKKFELNFSIPNFSQDSFRIKNDISSSILYDMGCYPFSLISFFGYNLNKKFKVRCIKIKKKLNRINIIFVSKKIQFNIYLAIYEGYENFVKVVLEDNSFYIFKHFFYGKKIQKINYFSDTRKKLKIYKINEKNLFREILNYSNQKLLKLSNAQYVIIEKYLNCLFQIKKKLNNSSY